MNNPARIETVSYSVSSIGKWLTTMCHERDASGTFKETKIDDTLSIFTYVVEKEARIAIYALSKRPITSDPIYLNLSKSRYLDLVNILFRKTIDLWCFKHLQCPPIHPLHDRSPFC